MLEHIGGTASPFSFFRSSCSRTIRTAAEGVLLAILLEQVGNVASLQLDVRAMRGGLRLLSLAKGKIDACGGLWLELRADGTYRYPRWSSGRSRSRLQTVKKSSA